MIEMPVSLALGTVLPSEFPVSHKDYNIMIELEKGELPEDDLECMVGATSSPSVLASCNQNNQPLLLQVAWTVRDSGRVVAQGISASEGGSGF